MRNSTWVWLLIVIGVIAGGMWWYNGFPGLTVDTTDNANTGTNNAGGTMLAGSGDGDPNLIGGDADPGTGAPATASVTYDGTSFTPATVTVRRGGTVTWRSEGTDRMWVASDVHPTHTTYSGTSRQEHCPDSSGNAFDQCATGSSYSFTFDKVGTWSYHDHVNASAGGTVVVVE